MTVMLKHCHLVARENCVKCTTGVPCGMPTGATARPVMAAQQVCQVALVVFMFGTAETKQKCTVCHTYLPSVECLAIHVHKLLHQRPYFSIRRTWGLQHAALHLQVTHCVGHSLCGTPALYELQLLAGISS